MRIINKLVLKKLVSSINFLKIILTILHIIFIVSIIIIPFLIIKGVVSGNFGNFIIEIPEYMMTFGLVVEISSLIILIEYYFETDLINKFFKINFKICLIIFILFLLELILVEFIWNIVLINTGCIKIL